MLLPAKYCLRILFISLSCFAAKGFAQWSFSENLEFIQQFDSPIVLKSADQQSQIVLSAKHQGRVLMSSANGEQGITNAWLDRKAMQSGMGNVGGEDRTWIAPIGSKFSVFYPAKVDISNETWRVPQALKLKNYLVLAQNDNSVHFQKSLELTNHQSTEFSIQLDRKITLLNNQQISKNLAINLPQKIKSVAYTSHSTLTNQGKDWQQEKGLLTIWSMAMLKGSADTLSMFAIQPEQAPAQSYLYPLYANRLLSNNHLIFFKTDGRYRSKIGIPAGISGEIMLSYSPSIQRLTVIKFALKPTKTYPISLEQEDTQHTQGDVTNAYNHGNMDGSLLAEPAFFELESAAPMLALKTNESVSHIQQVFHFVGNIKQLDAISSQLVSIKISDTDKLFKSE